MPLPSPYALSTSSLNSLEVGDPLLFSWPNQPESTRPRGGETQRALVSIQSKAPLRPPQSLAPAARDTG